MSNINFPTLIVDSIVSNFCFAKWALVFKFKPFCDAFFVKSMVTGQPSNCVTVDVIGLTNDTKSIITFQCADIFDDDFPKSLNDFYFDDGGFIVLLVQRH